MRTIPYDINLGMMRGNALNQDPRLMWDIQNGYINKINDVQQRNGLTAYNPANALLGIPAMYGTPAITCIEEIEWNSGNKDLIAKAGTSWWIFDQAEFSGTASATSAGKLVDTATIPFVATDKYKRVKNTTDGTYAYITSVDSSSQVTLSSDIFVSGEAYTVMAGWGELKGSRSGTYRGQVLMFRTSANAEILILIDGGTPQKVTSAYAVSDLGGSPPSDATCGLAYNYHLVLNSVATKGKVYVSALNNPEDYTSVSPIDALILELAYVTPIADDIVSFSPFSEDILVISGEKYTVTYNAPEDCNNWSKMQIIPCQNVSNYCNIFKGNELIFPTITGLQTMATLAVNKEIPSDDLSRDIAVLYQSLFSTLGYTSASQISGVYDSVLDLAYIVFPFSGTTQMLVFSFIHKMFVGRFLYSTLSLQAICRLVNGTILVADSAGVVYTMNSGTTDAGTAISFSITPAFDYFGTKGRYKRVLEVRLTVEHTVTFTCGCSYNFDAMAGGTALSKSVTAVALGRNIVRLTGFSGRGRAFQPVFTNSTSGAIINIPYWEIDIEDQGVK